MHQSMGLLMRSMFVSPLLAVAVSVVACVTPEQDYNDYVDRTADAHAPPPLPTFDAGETGPLSAPDAGFMSNTFFMACLTGNAEGDPTKASEFVAHANYAPTSGGGGTFIFSNQVLKSYPTKLSDIAPDGTLYDALPKTGATVNPDGTTTMTYGPTIIPGDANPVTNMQLTFSQTTLDFHIESESQMCAYINGDLTAPIVAMVNGPCIFRLLSSPTSDLPTFQLSDFHCP